MRSHPAPHHLIRRKQQLYILFTVLLGLVVFLGLFLTVTLYANWPAVKSELAYAFQPSTDSGVSVVATSPAATATPTPAPIVEAAHIVITKTNTDLPLQWDIPADKIVDSLSHGVAHLEGTAHLGQIGNVVVIGHSSDYVWKHNPYAAAFALLPKLGIGDTITIRENGQTYDYHVTKTLIVNPDQVEVIQPTKTPILTLVTCYPIGSTRQRFIVQANLVSSPAKPASATLNNFIVPDIKFR